MIYTYDVRELVEDHMDNHDLAADHKEHLMELANDAVNQTVQHIKDELDKLFT